MNMKKLFVYLLIGGAFTIVSCEDKRVQQEVIEVDTVGAEYEVEKQVREKTIDVDTVTKDVTIEKENPQ